MKTLGWVGDVKKTRKFGSNTQKCGVGVARSLWDPFCASRREIVLGDENLGMEGDGRKAQKFGSKRRSGAGV